MCRGAEALSDPVVGGANKQVAILEGKVKGGTQSDKGVRSSEAKIWRAASKSLFRPVTANDGVGHTGDSVLAPGWCNLTRDPLVRWASHKPGLILGSTTPVVMRELRCLLRCLHANTCYLGPRGTG